MILDNNNQEMKVHQWISKYTHEGELSIVTGYFTVGALAFLSRETRDKIKEYRFILGDIVDFDEDKDRSLDLLNENISIEASLKLKKLAQEAVAFLELDKVNAKTLEPNFCHAKLYIYKSTENDIQKNYYISGSSNLTDAGIGSKVTPNIELNISNFGADPQYKELITWFETLWERKEAHKNKTISNTNGVKKEIPFKEYLINEIKKIFVEYTPKQLYYKVLFELFGSDLLLDKNNPEFSKQIGRLENTEIYNKLYEFQQKGVLSLIKMLQKFNGAILADAVGLGKTWTALAVIKFYQLQGREVILICPKKLQHNWRVFLKHQNSMFEKDQFEYFMRFHTDLSDNLMDRYNDRQDKLFINNKPKLFVIDESHNLRNDKSKRYDFLVNKILHCNEDAKVLMLSATPINNSLIDIRNQFKLIVRGKVDGFNETLHIKNIDYTFKTAQKEFNDWTNNCDPKIGDFIKKLPKKFFELTDSLIVARTRKMIEGHQNGLEFPVKEKPINIFVTPENIGIFNKFDELLKHFPPMLSGYQPSFYVDKYNDAGVLHDEKQRDHFLVKMMYILMVKRLESSWFSFKSTIKKILDHHKNVLDNINKYQKTKVDTGWKVDQLKIFQDEDITVMMEKISLGKRAIRMVDIDRSGKLDIYKTDLKTDIEALQLLYANLSDLEKIIEEEIKTDNNIESEDIKLKSLINCILEKRKTGENNSNQKILIFTVYKDTATYLFDQLVKRGFDKVAYVSGESSKVWNEDEETKNFETILERFAPHTKLYQNKVSDFLPTSDELSDNVKYEQWKKWIADNDEKINRKLQNPIDILIATDVLSEGQNLQDCDMVVNYDIHWNPVRVIQRMGRIDRLGSPNEKIFGINFWPSENINTYLNLKNRIEQKMAAMRLAGSEVHLEFSDTFKDIADDENFEQKQNANMMKQMQTSWNDIEVSEQGLGFDNLSLETYRQELLEEVNKDEKYYKNMPNGIYTGFIGKQDICPKQGLIALMGYPCKPAKAFDFTYKSYELIYIDYSGKQIYLNQKEVLDALAQHKDEERFVHVNVDHGEENAIEQLSTALVDWLKSQSVTEELQDDGTVKERMGNASLDIITKLRTGDNDAVKGVKTGISTAEKYKKENFDLITWFLVDQVEN